MSTTIPKIKKRVNAFLVGEEGKISKKSLLKAGVVLGGVALAAAIAASHSQAVHANETGAQHGHKLEHSSHSSY